MIPLSKGLCCGFVSLRIALIAIAMADIVIGASAIGIGVTAFVKLKLEASLIVYSLINAVSLILSMACLYAIHNKKVGILRMYYYWKCVEVVVIPIFETLIISVTVSNASSLQSASSLTYYLFMGIKAVFRFYFAFLIYSYFTRLERGESLLVEYGERKLGKMIDNIQLDQQK